MSTPRTKTVAIFGATGGTGLATLKFTLQSGAIVNVLARTPSKLSALEKEYPTQLHVIQGDIRDMKSIKKTLAVNNRVVDVVVSAIGMVLRFQGFGIESPDPHICEEGTKNILSAIAELEREEKIEIPSRGPQMILLSTTGISDRGRDIPVAMIPFYHWVLSVPHLDKKKMEDLVVQSGRRWTLIRPSFLFDGDSKGLKSTRVSSESYGMDEGENASAKAVIGYSIRREDVALWIVEECIKPDVANWEGKIVTMSS